MKKKFEVITVREKAQSSKLHRTKWEMAGKDQHSTSHRWLFLLLWKDRTWRSRVLSHLSISVSIPATRATDHMYNRKSFKNRSGGASQTRGAQRNKTLKQKLDYSMLSTRVLTWAPEGRSHWRALDITKHSACHELRQFEWHFLDVSGGASVTEHFSSSRSDGMTSCTRFSACSLKGKRGALTSQGVQLPMYFWDSQAHFIFFIEFRGLFFKTPKKASSFEIFPVHEDAQLSSFIFLAWLEQRSLRFSSSIYFFE